MNFLRNSKVSLSHRKKLPGSESNNQKKKITKSKFQNIQKSTSTPRAIKTKRLSKIQKNSNLINF